MVQQRADHTTPPIKRGRMNSIPNTAALVRELKSDREAGKYVRSPVKKGGKHWWDRIWNWGTYVCPVCEADVVDCGTSHALGPREIDRRDTRSCEYYDITRYECKCCPYTYNKVNGPYYPM